MRTLILTTAIAALVAVPALAVPTVNGTVASGEYGAPSASVATDPAAPTSNFDTPGNTAKAGYNIYLSDVNDTLYGAIVQTGGVTAGTFANLYFDVDPVTNTNGSDFGLEVTNERGFTPGLPGYYDFASRIDWATTTIGGVTTTEFSVANSVFRDYIAAMAAGGFFGPGGYVPQNVRLNLSQSLSYSVAGGDASYGTQRLGTFSVALRSAAPEPASWAMMVGGFGLIGSAMRRRQRTSIRFA